MWIKSGRAILSVSAKRAKFYLVCCLCCVGFCVCFCLFCLLRVGYLSALSHGRFISAKHQPGRAIKTFFIYIFKFRARWRPAGCVAMFRLDKQAHEWHTQRGKTAKTEDLCITTLYARINFQPHYSNFISERTN